MRQQRTDRTTTLISCLLLLATCGCNRGQGSKALTTPSVLAAKSPSAPESTGIERYCGSEIKAGRILVKRRHSGQFEESNFLAQVNTIANDKVATEKIGDTDVLVVRSTTGRSVENLLESFNDAKKKAPASIDYVEPDYVIRLDSLPTDPDDPGVANQWGLGKISAFSAWQVPTDDKVVVAIIDSGIDYNHEDLQGNIWSSPPGFSVQIGGKTIRCPIGSHGFDATAADTDTDEKKCNPWFANGHGTHVAGIIGAANNKSGGRGVDSKANIMAIKFTDEFGEGCVSTVLRALDFIAAASKSVNIRVINCSFGFNLDQFYACHSNPQILLAALQRIDSANILIVASNGNEHLDTSTNPQYPSGYSLPNLIAVMATDENDKAYYASGYDPTSANLIGAPGNGIWSTLPCNTYDYLSGTSMATPFVSGAAAFVLSNTGDKCDKLTATQLKNDLLENADKIVNGNLENYIMKGRRLNVDKAVRMCGH